MGKVVALKPFLPKLPEKLGPLAVPARVPVIGIVRPACEWLYENDPEVIPLLESVSNDTSPNERVQFDQCILAQKVRAKVKDTLPDSVSLGKIGKAITQWMKERDIARRPRRLAARRNAQARIAVAE
jgi:hypothetical protein